MIITTTDTTLYIAVRGFLMLYTTIITNVIVGSVIWSGPSIWSTWHQCVHLKKEVSPWHLTVHTYTRPFNDHGPYVPVWYSCTRPLKIHGQFRIVNSGLWSRYGFFKMCFPHRKYVQSTVSESLILPLFRSCYFKNICFIKKCFSSILFSRRKFFYLKSSFFSRRIEPLASVNDSFIDDSF